MAVSAVEKCGRLSRGDKKNGHTVAVICFIPNVNKAVSIMYNVFTVYIKYVQSINILGFLDSFDLKTHCINDASSSIK